MQRKIGIELETKRKRIFLYKKKQFFYTMGGFDVDNA